MRLLASSLGLVGIASALAWGQELPSVKVDLPPQPAWSTTTVPEKYPDGKWSIRGVRKRMKDTLGQEVAVKGTIVSIYVCPPEQQKCKGKNCKPCDVPHFFIGDTKDTRVEKALMVCNYPVKPKPPALPPVGTELVVSGTFTKDSGGFTASDGLIDHAQTATPDGKVIMAGNALKTKEADMIRRSEGKGREAPPK